MGHAKRDELEMVSLELAQAEMIRRGKIAEDLIKIERPDLINLFLTYQNEAVAARKFLERSLIELDAGAEILEVGGGTLALATQLASEGFSVTTVEPVGEGFSGISFIMQVFKEISNEEDLKFNLNLSPIEVCEFEQKFDFIFSINVMEHLHDPYSVLFQMNKNMKPNGRYRFFCPNYDFPYEPHFDKWIYSRKNGAFFLKPNLTSKATIDSNDSKQLYQSINFLTLRKIKFFLNKHNFVFNTNKNAFYEILSRSINDSGLQKRHSSLHKVVLLIEKIGLLWLAKLIPVNFQPIIDMTIYKTKV